EEFSQAKYCMLNTMRQQDWPEEHISMIRNFWLELENHKYWHGICKFSKNALLIYQGCVWHQWHQTISTPDSFMLTPLNKEHLNSIKRNSRMWHGRCKLK
ncbi:hypothetical protein PAXRUDRAFT_168527, partial [Paxillus rubicundulus Ve08.2h10]